MSKNQDSLAEQVDDSYPSSSSQSTIGASGPVDVEGGGGIKASSLWTYLNTDVDIADCSTPLAAFCLMTGFLNTISFFAVDVWCGFQTGNFAQLALSLAHHFKLGPPTSDTPSTLPSVHYLQALISLLGFNAGAFFGRWGDHLGPSTRLWLFIGTIVQALLTIAASLTIWKGHHSAPTDALALASLAFMSASLGLQGIQAKRLNTQFTTTVVLTSVWVELMTDPGLFKIGKRVASRDHRIYAAGSLFLGVFVGYVLMGKIGAAGALGVGAGVRVLISLAWLLVRDKEGRIRLR